MGAAAKPEVKPGARTVNGQFVPGQSGYPGGIFKRLREVQSVLIEKWSPKADVVMEELLRIATGATKLHREDEELVQVVDCSARVAAAKVFLDHAAPALKSQGAEKESPPANEAEAEERVINVLQKFAEDPARRERVLSVLQGGKQ